MEKKEQHKTELTPEEMEKVNGGAHFQEWVRDNGGDGKPSATQEERDRYWMDRYKGK